MRTNEAVKTLIKISSYVHLWEKQEQPPRDMLKLSHFPNHKLPNLWLSCRCNKDWFFAPPINISTYILCNSCIGKHKTQAMPLTTINTVISNECKIYLGSLQNAAHLMVVGVAAVAVNWHLNLGKSRMLVMPTLPKVLESQILEAFTCNELSSTKPMLTSNIIT